MKPALANRSFSFRFATLPLLGSQMLHMIGSSGCLQELPKRSLVADLRVIGIQAEPPEVAPGASVSLTALVAHPEAVDISLRWYACIVPERGSGFGGGGAGQTGASGGKGYGLDDTGECASDAAVAAGLSIFLGEGHTTSLEVPTDFLSVENTKRAYGIAADAEVPELALLGLWSIAGVNYTVALRAESADGQVRTAFKRVNVSLAAEPNQNPSPVAFAFGPEPEDEASSPPVVDSRADVDVLPEPGRCFATTQPIWPGRWRITPLGIPDPPLTYPVLVGGSSADRLFEVRDNDETLFYSYLATAGAIASNVTKSTGKSHTTWTLEGPPPPEVDLWVVIRDARGGTSWCHERFSTLPEPPPEPPPGQ